MVQFQASITKKEYKKVSVRFLLKKSWIFKIIIPVMLLNFLFTASLPGAEFEDIVRTVLLPLAIIILLLIVINVSLNKSIEKAYNNLPVFNETVMYTIDENGLRIKGESFEANMPWSRFDYIWIKAEFLVFFQTSAIGNIIPKRNLSPQQMQELLQYADNSGVKIKGIKR